MSHTKYLVIGSSHAGLSAVDAIRLQDGEGPITMVSGEKCLPYSPTVLPYVVSGEVDPDRIFLRDQEYFNKFKVSFLNDSRVVGVDSDANMVTLESGNEIHYEKLLLATGAAPELPPIPGLENAPCHVLRTLEDAQRIRTAMENTQSAIILGAGLIGMHAAENLAKAGLQVTVVEMLPRVLPGYFDERAAGLIQRVFAQNGVKVLTGSAVTHVTTSNRACALSLENGLDLSAHLLLVSTGVKPRMEYLAGSEVETDAGILVDDRMRTSVSNIWAAGDVAQARSFFDSEKILNGILPDAVEQGRIAGMDIVADQALKLYSGGIPMNTYSFFGHRAISVGISVPPSTGEEFQVDFVFSPTSLRYQKLVFQNDNLVGVSAINAELDPGVMWQIIRRQVDLGDIKDKFASAPLETGRLLMSKIWR